EQDRRAGDGPFLLDVFRQRHSSMPAEEIGRATPPVLVALCLQDEGLTVPPLLPLARQEGERWLTPQRGACCASDELYQELGVPPPRARVGLRQEVLFRLEQRDTALAAELLDGVLKSLGAKVQAPSAVTGRYAQALARLEHPVPEGSTGLDLTAY